ncbi:MAG TPA: hypothetical protein V6D29_17385 [Leptolyngbyaceae cyanobacterium]
MKWGATYPVSASYRDHHIAEAQNRMQGLPLLSKKDAFLGILFTEVWLDSRWAIAIARAS